MHDDLLLSIIIPVYNVEKYIPDCLNSCLNQGLDETEYEIICVDDGSTDNSLSILKSYEHCHKNVIVLTKQNGGVSSARNLALDYARGKYIWFIDSDDYIYSNSAVTILSSIQQNNAEQCVFSYEKGTLNYDVGQNYRQGKVKFLTKRYTTPNAVSWMFSKDIIDKNHIRFCTDLKYGEDTFFVFQYSIFANINKTLKLESNPYYYRTRIGSAMNGRKKMEAGGIILTAC